VTTPTYEEIKMNSLHNYLKQGTPPWERLKLFTSPKSKEEQREIRRWRSIYSLYNLTRWQWQAIFERQRGCCAICGISQVDLGYTLEIDYDHVLGKVRGLLCKKCNLGIGMFGEDITRIEKAIRYLKS
jgi:hypothetical protein